MFSICEDECGKKQEKKTGTVHNRVLYCETLRGFVCTCVGMNVEEPSRLFMKRQDVSRRSYESEGGCLFYVSRKLSQ